MGTRSHAHIPRTPSDWYTRARPPNWLLDFASCLAVRLRRPVGWRCASISDAHRLAVHQLGVCRCERSCTDRQRSLDMRVRRTRQNVGLSRSLRRNVLLNGACVIVDTADHTQLLICHFICAEMRGRRVNTAMCAQQESTHANMINYTNSRAIII